MARTRSTPSPDDASAPGLEETSLSASSPDAADAPSGPAASDTDATGSADALPEDIAALSYEAARDQLVDVVRRLESGQGGLEESIALWERGEMLTRRCQHWLDGAREKLEEAVSARR